MNKIVKFIKECDCFMVGTFNDKYPALRPFGAMMEHKGKLYICTNCKKKVYKQIKQNNHIAISAIKRGKREWMRFNADAKEVDDIKLKNLFFKTYPRLNIIYGSVDSEVFRMFEITINSFEKYDD